MNLNIFFVKLENLEWNLLLHETTRVSIYTRNSFIKKKTNVSLKKIEYMYSTCRGISDILKFPYESG